MKSLPRYLGGTTRDVVRYLYDLALYADEHIGRSMGLDLERVAEDLVEHGNARDKECRDWRRAAEELEVQTLKHIK